MPYGKGDVSQSRSALRNGSSSSSFLTMNGFRPASRQMNIKASSRRGWEASMPEPSLPKKRPDAVRDMGPALGKDRLLPLPAINLRSTPWDRVAAGASAPRAGDIFLPRPADCPLIKSGFRAIGINSIFQRRERRAGKFNFSAPLHKVTHNGGIHCPARQRQRPWRLSIFAPFFPSPPPLPFLPFPSVSGPPRRRRNRSPR